MKNIYTKLCLSAIGCLMMASCDFLDVVPQGTATVDDIYRTQYQAEGMVLSCYANIPNYFHPQRAKEEQRAGFISAVWFMGKNPQQRLITHYGAIQQNLIRRVL